MGGGELVGIPKPSNILKLKGGEKNLANFATSGVEPISHGSK